MKTPASFILVLTLAGWGISGGAIARAGPWNRLNQHDVDVITVTDLTDAGRHHPAATPDNPVYYTIYDVGEVRFGPAWDGERLPTNRDARRWLKAAIAEQGYRLADARHPPTLVLVFSWGMLTGGTGINPNVKQGDTITMDAEPDRPALRFLGGDKLDLMWEKERYGGFLDPRVLTRGMRSTLANKVFEFSQDDLFLGKITAYSMASIDARKPVALWETRFACPSTGLWLQNALPLMIKAAARSVGRETLLPVNVNASQEFGGRVDMGEMVVIGLDVTSGEPSAKHVPPSAPAKAP